MPTVTVDFPAAQLEEIEAYAQRYQLTLSEVVSRALDRFLALACIEPDDVSLIARETDSSATNDIRDRDL
jgi:hypothetical protein